MQEYVEIPAGNSPMVDEQLWSITNNREREDYQLDHFEVDEAIEMINAMCKAQPRYCSRYISSVRPSGRKALHAHSDYGFIMAVEQDDAPNPTVYIASIYMTAIFDAKLRAHASKLARDMISVGFPMHQMLQWFDSMVRLSKKLRTSPYFKPNEHFDKLEFTIRPALDILIKSGRTFYDLGLKEV